MRRLLIALAIALLPSIALAGHGGGGGAVMEAVEAAVMEAGEEAAATWVVRMVPVAT